MESDRALLFFTLAFRGSMSIPPPPPNLNGAKV